MIAVSDRDRLLRGCGRRLLRGSGGFLSRRGSLASHPACSTTARRLADLAITLEPPEREVDLVRRHLQRRRDFFLALTGGDVLNVRVGQVRENLCVTIQSGLRARTTAATPRCRGRGGLRSRRLLTLGDGNGRSLRLSHV